MNSGFYLDHLADLSQLMDWVSRGSCIVYKDTKLSVRLGYFDICREMVLENHFAFTWVKSGS